MCIVTFRIKQILIVYICFRFFSFLFKKRTFQIQKFSCSFIPQVNTVLKLKCIILVYAFVLLWQMNAFFFFFFLISDTSYLLYILFSVFFFLTMFLGSIRVDKGGPDLLILTSLHCLLFEWRPLQLCNTAIIICSKLCICMKETFIAAVNICPYAYGKVSFVARYLLYTFSVHFLFCQ